MTRPAALSLPWRNGERRLTDLAAIVAAAVALPVLGLVALLGRGAMRVFGRPASWLTVLTWGLAFHVAMIAFLFGTLGLPSAVVRVIAGWKEAAAILLVAAVTVRAVLRRGPRTPIVAADMPVIVLIVLSVAMLVAGQILFVEQPRPIAMRLYGLRESCFLFTMYFVGRATPEIAADDRFLKRFVRVGVVLSLIALLEALFVSAETLALLGVSLYFQDFLGVEMFSEGSQFGLPHYYFTLVGGRTVQRAGSVFLSSQGFAVSFLLVLPAAALWLFEDTRRTRPWRWAVMLVLGAGLLSTVTRMTTLAVGLELVVVLLLVRRFDLLALLTAAGIAVMAASMLVVPGLAEFVWKSLTWQTGSSISHAEDWKRGFLTMMAYPLGSGLGTADLTPAKFGYQSLTADNLFLKYAVELGILGGIAFASVLAGFGATAYALYRRGVTQNERWLGALVFAATIGIAFNGITAVVFNGTWLAYLYAWLAGSAVTVGARSRRA